METGFGNWQVRPFPGGYASFQQIYASNLFNEVTSSIVITEIAFRVDENATSDLDTTSQRLNVVLNVYRGSLGEIIERQSGAQIPLLVVFRDDLRMQGRAGVTNAFDIRIPLQKHFSYDWKVGHLVMSLERASYSERINFDAHARSPQDGFSILTGMQKLFESGVIITKFTYYLPPQIVTCQLSGTVMEFAFEFVGSIQDLFVESSTTVSGPYALIGDAELISLGPGKGSAKFSASERRQFFRIQQAVP